MKKDENEVWLKDDKVLIKVYGDTKNEATSKFREYYKKIVKGVDVLDIVFQRINPAREIGLNNYEMTGTIKFSSDAIYNKKSGISKVIEKLKDKWDNRPVIENIRTPSACCVSEAEKYIDINKY